MFWALITVISLHLAAGGAPSHPAPDKTPANSLVAPSDSSTYDLQAERQLLEMANAERAHAGLAPLKMDDGLVRAARAHAAEWEGDRGEVTSGEASRECDVPGSWWGRGLPLRDAGLGGGACKGDLLEKGPSTGRHAHRLLPRARECTARQAEAGFSLSR